ncbi:MAG: D-alanyl-D-alanine carboxypeptidase [Chitinophagaceae bacterium]|nr:D-alanyl-D-alanine carboxypeptidase [Chitinophagaceae bacterium]
MKLQHSLFLVPCSIFILASCSVSKQVSRQANTLLLKDTAIRTGHIGISIFEPETGKYWYNHNATKNFIPASNTKLFTLYAGMKYLGDSLAGLKYQMKGDSTIVEPSGDPTFLLSEFRNQPVLDFLKTQKNIYLSEAFLYKDFLGNGWAWNDYKESYMAQRSSFPVYGNIVTVKWINQDSIHVYPTFYQKQITVMEKLKTGFELIKGFEDNHFVFVKGNQKNKDVPIRPTSADIQSLLEDTLKIKLGLDWWIYDKPGKLIIHSQPSDSLFKPMMYRSDNFFAEQTLLMASNERLGYMSDEAIIDTLLKLDLKDVPQKPRWVDGSGLSRYNLFTPQSFVYILHKMRNEFGWDRVKNILPTGGTGTLSSYYKKESGFIYAKTGTLSNNCALSGYMITKKGKLLIFSVLANNYSTGATPVRKAVEQFLVGIREKY